LKKLGIPATEIADKLKDDHRSVNGIDTKIFANAVMFGAFLELCAPRTKDDQVKQPLKHVLAGKKEGLLPLNLPCDYRREAICSQIKRTSQ
jgi:Pyruvate/2-oxoacid:ferredoxin oxidoreductase gamma subunit